MRAFIFDTETTDLITNTVIRSEHRPRIMELYGCITDDTEAILDEVYFRCNPGVRIPAEVTKITGITDKDVNTLPGFEHSEGRVRGLLGGAEAIVAHNLSFDWRVLNMEFERVGTLDKVIWPSIRICTVEQTEHLKGHRLKLIDLHELLFGEGFVNAHSAKADVMALKRVYHELRKRGEI